MNKYCRPFTRGQSWRSQQFGANPNNGTNGPGGHTGNDEAAPVGTLVHAAGDGVVVYAGTFDNTYADNFLWLLDFGGNILVLDCGDDEPTFIYAHLQEFTVKAGERVSKGQIVALSGNTGTRTTGAHLHMEAIPPGYTLQSPTLGRTDPDRYLTEWPEDLSTITAQSITITPLETLKKGRDKMLVITQSKGDTAIWIGDGITRRQIPDLDVLGHYRKLAQWGVLTIFKDGQTMDYPPEALGKAI